MPGLGNLGCAGNRSPSHACTSPPPSKTNRNSGSRYSTHRNDESLKLAGLRMLCSNFLQQEVSGEMLEPKARQKVGVSQRAAYRMTGTTDSLVGSQGLTASFTFRSHIWEYVSLFSFRISAFLMRLCLSSCNVSPVLLCRIRDRLLSL